mmetsp:Transcript_40426/g.64820  ORF Transcript_40426/g.64820 Transcript_40426/m.64820 type:complete len:588 (-) Transcript_40426:58-1821(-)
MSTLQSTTNKLSWWAWGETIPSNLSKAAETSFSRISKLLNIDEHELFPIPRLDNVTLNEPRFNLDSHALSGILVANDKRSRAQHAYGRSTKDYLRTIMEDFSCAPDYVVYPTTNEQIHSLLQYCDHHKIAVVTYGGGTSVVGGTETNLYPRTHYKGVISLDLTRMDKVLSVNQEDQTITVQPGLRGMQLEEYLKANYPHLTLRHFPQSYEFASIGGMMVTRSGGHFAVGRTRIDHFLQCAKLITPSKGILETPQIPSSGSGLEMNAIIKGSEGIFGVVTDITLKLLRRPKYKRNVKIEFQGMSFLDAAQYLREFVQCGLEPANCRLVDGMESFTNGLSASPETPACIVGFESHLSNDFQAEMDNITHIVQRMNEARNQKESKVGGKAVIASDSNARGDAQRDRKDAIGNWYYSFLSAPYLRDKLLRTGLLMETFETCIKWSLLRSLHDEICATVKDGVQQLFYGECGYVLTKRFTHLYGDGVAIYFTLMVDPRKQYKVKFGDDYKRYLNELLVHWCRLKDMIQACIVRNTGSSTHHHAVGKDHSESMVNEIKYPLMDYYVHQKSFFDQNWILNPGVLVPFIPNRCKL